MINLDLKSLSWGFLELRGGSLSLRWWSKNVLIIFFDHGFYRPISAGGFRNRVPLGQKWNFGSRDIIQRDYHGSYFLFVFQTSQFSSLKCVGHTTDQKEENRETDVEDGWWPNPDVHDIVSRPDVPVSGGKTGLMVIRFVFLEQEVMLAINANGHADIENILYKKSWNFVDLILGEAATALGSHYLHSR